MAGSQTNCPDPSSYPFPLPTILTHPASAPPTLITQGAEGRLYKTTYLRPDLPCALKHRPSKPYRHPILDARLTRQRILAEARILSKCRRDGTAAGVPAVYALDEAAGWLMLEWIEGVPVRVSINEWLKRRIRLGTLTAIQEDEQLVKLMRKMGTAVAAIHRVGVVHGDLTTSNMMLRPSKDQGEVAEDRLLDGDVVVIDFGLASQSVSDEDRAVDLYVLERAFGSTHPKAEVVFDQVLKGYQEGFKQATPVLRKLEDVRMRGRKRSMIG
ncbi:serine/threonine-protein kinase bud32 [Pyricularia grisea]|uniref:EKC/KEOPS complex subunit BUD32 n=1 Tax=Pyricularia grisea TaxID=148305 RepID=A0A6P8BC92_PYRGI|nr:uncharacterized protein PgNI_04278 [Pyricularia grisea]KAI6371358.1 serine/threonine-protein kinase bud32 [Pyricularia grisea]TLD13312.1 hypothetical protein PgNI_04278 [Pyricularia grisea]